MSYIKSLYVRNDYDNRAVSIASTIFRENDKIFVKFGWAFKSSTDQFVKKEGRKIAIDRLKSNDTNYSGIIEIPEIKFIDTAILTIEHIMAKTSTPKKYYSDLMYYRNELIRQKYFALYDKRLNQFP